QPELPADAHRAGPELLPVVFDMRGVAQLEPRACRVDRAERDLEPGDPAAELPGDRELARRDASLDLAAGVAFQLIATAEAQLARDRQEPARAPLRAGAGLPEV